ncbi:MAG: hypothetical protein QOD77_1897 [Thermoplasmata archaeon]|jgi:hypothetical protein|nr:hypothetical protein [Thermoplasmata archaeon]
MEGNGILAGCGHCSPRTVQSAPCPTHRRACFLLTCSTCGAAVRHAEAAA